MKITRVVATTVDVPLPKPIVMGELRFDSREYVLVRIDTDDGASGIGFGMTRGAPVAEIVARNLAPLLLGQDPLMTEHLWERLYYRNLTISGRGIFMRALSAVDIALWDIKGHAAGMPVWQLLGGAREHVPVSVAGAYVRDGTTLDELRAEITDYVDRGYALIKVAAGDLLADGERLRVADEVIRGRAELAYDAHWAWRSLYDVVPVLKTWSDLPIAFIEDPFAPELVGLAPQLRADTGLRVALGEDAVGRWAFLSLLAELKPDLVRLDATTMGGPSEAARVCGLASMHALPVIPHVFPEVHQHLGFAFPIIRAVEITQPEYELETLYRLFKRWVTIEDGCLVAPTSPGLGMEFDAAVVKRYTVREFDTKA